jgi:predicted permease
MNLFPLDLKLGCRMIVKYPGLTVVGGLAMAFAIWVGALTFEMVRQFTRPSLPLPDGKRIVQVQNWDAARSQSEMRSLHDYLSWKSSLSTITDLGTWRDIAPNLRGANGDVRPVTGAEVTASGFRIAGAMPLMGRMLTEADEASGAPPVVVLGFRVWRDRFDSDPAIVGRSVRLGEAFATVVGVMPEDFAFPVYHELWMPFRPALLDQSPGAGPSITVFGRLVAGTTIEEAQTELTLLGRRAAAEFPATHEHLQPRVTPYAQLFFQPTGTDFKFLLSFNLFAILLLVLICSNVALLMFARAAGRENELVVRSALGASRFRLTAQFFSEALVLGGLASAVGLGAAAFALERWGRPYFELNLGTLPFWYDIGLSPPTVLYALGLTLLGAGVAGVLPALKVTRGLGQRLRAGSAGAGGLRFGGVWTGVIITQVALTVAFPAVIFVELKELIRIRSYDVGFAASQYLGVRLEADSGTIPVEALRARVAAEPGVAGVTFVDQLPRLFHREGNIELDHAPATVAAPPEVSTARIDPSYFQVLRAPLRAGRTFHSGDAGAPTVIVDQTFVDEILQGQNAIGRRIRFVPREPDPTAPPEPWFEIVGVVPDLGMAYATHQHRTAGVYLAMNPRPTGTLHMMIHAQGDPMALGTRVRALATEVDPTLRVAEIIRVDRVTDGIQWFLGLWLQITVVLTAIGLLLSLAGIYAVLSFTVARRTREIGVRVALGAGRGRVVAEIFRRPLTHVGVGVCAGGLLIVAGAIAMAGSLTPMQLLLLAGYVGVMLAVCLLACIVPTRRALSVEPTEALRGE